VGIGNAAPNFALDVVSSGTRTINVTATAAGAVGVYSSSTGVGVRGDSASPTGGSSGVRGDATSAGVQAFGVHGTTASSVVSGGISSAGVYGRNNASDGVGVLGIANVGSATGVRGETDSTGIDASGVYGASFASSGRGYGVWGSIARNGNDAAAVYGTASGATGRTYGVFGTNGSSNVDAAGVRGDGVSGTRGNSFAAADGSNPTASSRLRAGGVVGTTTNPNGNAGYFQGRVVIENSTAGGSTTSGTDALIIWTNGPGSGAAGFNSSGAVFSPSDRNIKSDFQPVDTVAVLDKLTATPITRWHYRNDEQTWYMGPMAQDFSASFGLGDKDTIIHGVNADGVAFAAIQGLNAKLVEKLKVSDARIDSLEQRLSALENASTRNEPALGTFAAMALLTGGPLAAIFIAVRRRRAAV